MLQSEALAVVVLVMFVVVLVVVVVVVLVVAMLVMRMVTVPLVAFPPAVTVPVAVAMPADDYCRTRHHSGRLSIDHGRSRLDIDGATLCFHIPSRKCDGGGACGKYAKDEASCVASEHDDPLWKRTRYLQSTAASSRAVCCAG